MGDEHILTTHGDMASRYIARRYDSSVSDTKTRSASMGRARSQSREPSQTHYTRCRSSSPSRSSGVSQYSSNLQYYRPNESIHERDLLFSNFISKRSSSGMYSANNISNMVQDSWSRKQREDPSVAHDFARKASAWSNYLTRGSSSASEVLGRKHSAARLEKSNFSLPKIYVYHNSAC